MGLFDQPHENIPRVAMGLTCQKKDNVLNEFPLNYFLVN